MSANELIVSGEADEPGSVTFWTRGSGRDLTVYEKRPMVWLGTEPVSCRLAREEIAEVAVALIDPARIGQFQVRLRGTLRIRPNHESKLIRARAQHGGIDLAICDATRRALNAWRGRGHFIDQLFPAGRKEASEQAVGAVIAALADIGLEVEAARIEPLGWNSDERIPLELGPQRVHCSGVGGSLNVSVHAELVPDSARMAVFLTTREASAGKGSIREAVESHVYEWLEMRYSRHQHSYEAAVIAAALRAELDDFCGRRFGRRVVQLRFDNGSGSLPAPEPERFEFTAKYKIAASNAEFEMTHRGTVIVSDVGRAPGGLAQRRNEAEDRIRTAIQTRVLSYSADKVRAELHTFKDENASPLSRWVIEDEKLGAELAARGLTLEHLYVFTNEARPVPVPQGRTYRHITPYHISGTDRVLTLIHNLFWHVGSTRAEERLYIECGTPAPEQFEEAFLGRELDAQTAKRLLAKTFDAIIFDYFGNQAKTEAKLTEDLQGELAAYAAKYGVEVSTMTTVLEQLPEAKLLTEHTVAVEKATYSLADSTDKIEVSAKIKVRMARGGKGSALRQHLMGRDPQAIFETLTRGVAEQIEFFLAGVEPWEVFAMDDESITYSQGTELSLTDRLKGKVATWLGTFGLEIIESDGFRLQVGECKLRDARKWLIGLEEEIEVSALVHSERMNSSIGTDVRGEAALTLPFLIKEVGPSPAHRRRFMDALRSKEGPDPERILDKIRNIIDRAVRVPMQRMPLGAFNSQNFASRPFAQAFADISAHEVLKSLGLVIFVSPLRVLPHVKGTLPAHEAIRNQELLLELKERLWKALARPDPEQSEIDAMRKRIADQEKETSKVVKAQGVGGALDAKALRDAMNAFADYMRQHNISSHLLGDLREDRSAPPDAATEEAVHDEIVAEYEVIDENETPETKPDDGTAPR